MGTTIDDIYMDQYYEEQAIEDLIAEKIDDQEWDNIRGYYLGNSESYAAIINSIEIARSLINDSYYIASLLHSNIAVELMIRKMFIAPILAGSIFNEIISDITTEHILKASGISQLDKIVRHLVSEKSSIKLESYKGKNVWQQVKKIREIRNGIEHRGDQATIQDAELALETASLLLNDVVSDLLKRFKLKAQGGQILTIKTHNLP